MAFMASTILTGPFDAVLPLHLKRTFSFNALTSGSVFCALALPEMLLGPLSGWLTDRYGTKLVALFGFLALCPALFLLIIPMGPATPAQILSLIGILALNGYTLDISY
jgi:nitrate/nitrite transporter NarK